MAVKIVEVAEIGKVALYKRKGVRGVRLSIAHDGSVRVTLPTWAPYRLGIEFVNNKTEWILQRQKPVQLIKNGSRVGKAHTFVFEQRSDINNPKTRIIGTEIRLGLPGNLSLDDNTVQLAAEKAAIRALKKEAEQLLPQRLETLSTQYGFKYRSVNVKRLKSRWGSCNEHKDIVLNCFLMQLPWHLIDYVLLHELTHTVVLRHGDPFWSELGKYVRNVKDIRKEMKQHQPTLKTAPAPVYDQSGATPLQVAIETL